MTGETILSIWEKQRTCLLCKVFQREWFCISICNEEISTAILLSNRSKLFLSFIIVYFLLELSLPLPCLIRLSNLDSRFTVCDENVLHDDPSEVDSPSHWSLSPLSVEDILSDTVGLDRLNSSHTVCLIITSIALQYTIWLSNVSICNYQ